MLAKKSRLKKNKEFDQVFKEGKSAYGKLLGIKIRKNQLDINRFGILLSTKVSKLAVIRNLYKRRIREIIGQDNFQLKKGYDCVVIVMPAIINSNYQDIKTEIKNIFNKLKFYS